MVNPGPRPLSSNSLLWLISCPPPSPGLSFKTEWLIFVQIFFSNVKETKKIPSPTFFCFGSSTQVSSSLQEYDSSLFRISLSLSLTHIHTHTHTYTHLCTHTHTHIPNSPKDFDSYVSPKLCSVLTKPKFFCSYSKRTNSKSLMISFLQNNSLAQQSFNPSL